VFVALKILSILNWPLSFQNSWSKPKTLKSDHGIKFGLNRVELFQNPVVWYFIWIWGLGGFLSVTREPCNLWLKLLELVSSQLIGLISHHSLLCSMSRGVIIKLSTFCICKLLSISLRASKAVIILVRLFYYLLCILFAVYCYCWMSVIFNLI